MIPNTIIKVFLLTTCVSLFYGCDKEKEGCGDLSATNFCQGCDVVKNNDCEYSGDGVFWYQDWVGDTLEAQGSYSLSYFIDDEFIGTTPIYHGYWPPDPIFGNPPQAYCGHDSAFTFTKTWKGNSVRVFNYSVKNQAGLKIWSGSVSFKAKTCTSKELY